MGPTDTEVTVEFDDGTAVLLFIEVEQTTETLDTSVCGWRASNVSSARKAVAARRPDGAVLRRIRGLLLRWLVLLLLDIPAAHGTAVPGPTAGRPGPSAFAGAQVRTPPAGTAKQ